MQVFIIAALSADGFIARDNKEPSTKWTSKEDTRHFIERTKKAGVIVMGSRTFETFGAKPLPNRRNIIYSRAKKYSEVETTRESPNELLARLKKEGVSEVAIAGGSSIYTLFAEAGVVNNLILTLENVIFGEGVPLFNKKIDMKVNLASHTQIGPNTVVLEYTVSNN
jgi:dihydrofolate reductase